MRRLLKIMLSMNMLLFFIISASALANDAEPLTVGKSYDFSYNEPTDVTHTLVVFEPGYYRLTIENRCSDVKSSNQAFMRVKSGDDFFLDSVDLSDGKEYLDIYIEKVAQIEVFSGQKYRLTLTKKVIQDRHEIWRSEEKRVSFDESITLDTGLLAEEEIKFEWSVGIDELFFEKIEDANGPSYTLPAASYEKTEYNIKIELCNE